MYSKAEFPTRISSSVNATTEGTVYFPMLIIINQSISNGHKFTVVTMNSLRSVIFNDRNARICRAQINSYRNHSTKLMKNQVFGVLGRESILPLIVEKLIKMVREKLY